MTTRELPRDKIGFRELSLSAIRRWRILLVAIAGLILLSIFAWRRMPRAEDPIVDLADANIVLGYPGAAPEDVESQVITEVEPLIYAMDGVEYVESHALPGRASLDVHFARGTAMDVAVEKMRGIVLGARKSIPAEVEEPIVTRLSTSRAVQMVVAVTGNRADATLDDTAKQLRSHLAAVRGVANVTLRGARERAVRVRLNPTKLASYHLSTENVVQALKRANVRSPGGAFVIGSVATLLRVDNELKDVAAVRAVPVAAPANAPPVSLGDVAEVLDDYAPAHERFMQDGIPAVGLEVRFGPNEDAIAIGKRVRDAVHTDEASMPEGVRAVVAFDKPDFVEETIGSFVESLVEGIALVMLVVTLGMGWRAAVVVAMVLPICIGGAIFGLYGLGFSLEQVSIAGLIVALGLLVDDAVVVTESVQLMRDRGLSPVRAAVFGTARVFWANNGTTAVACASFLPLFFLSGEVGDFARGLPVAVVLALVLSLVLAQLFTPWATTLLLRKPAGVRDVPDSAAFDRENDGGEDARAERNIGIRAIKWMYARALPYVLRFPVTVILLAIATLLCSFALLPKIGFQFFPKSDKPLIFVALDLPRGSGDDRVMDKTAEAVGILQKDPDVLATSAVMGSSYPGVFVGRHRPTDNAAIGDILVQLKRGARTDVVARRLRQALADLSAVDSKVEELYKGPGITHPVSIRITGDSFEKLEEYAEQVKTTLRAAPGTLSINDTLNETVPLTNVRVDVERAARLGLTPLQVGSTLRQLYGEDDVSDFRADLDTVKLIIDTGDEPARPLDALGQTPVPSSAGALVPLIAVADVGISAGHSRLQHRNQRRMVEIYADLDGKALASDVIKRVRPALAKMTLAPGYLLTIAGEEEKTNESFGNLRIAAGGAVLFIFLLLLGMFDSYKLSLVVLAAFPFGLIGAITGLYVSGNAFGFMSFLGLIALLGVYANHKIYLVDRMQELLRRGVPWRSAVLRAGIDRLRPVVLTALTAVLGLVPLTLEGGALWSGFGWVNIFGLVTSIPLSLLLLPAIIAVAYRNEKNVDRQRQEATPSVLESTLVIPRPPLTAAPPPPSALESTLVIPRHLLTAVPPPSREFTRTSPLWPASPGAAVVPSPEPQAARAQTKMTASAPDGVAHVAQRTGHEEDPTHLAPPRTTPPPTTVVVRRRGGGPAPTA